MTRTKTSEIPADDPGAVLGRLVRRQRLRYTRAFVSGRVAKHPQPNSLLALVEVGAELGLKITAARTDASGLDELRAPIVVHFAGDGGEGGFAVLEGVVPGGFLIWDSRDGGRHVERDVFLAHWSGVVGVVERDDSQRVPESGYLQHRLLELLAGSAAPPALAGSRAAPALRAALVAIMASLVVIAAVEHPADTRAAAIALIVLTLIGLGVTTALSVAIADLGRPLSLPGCPRGKVVNCESVLTSPYSRIAGIPLSEIGTAFFGSIMLLMATAAIAPERSIPWVVAGGFYLAGVPIALLLVGVQIFMRQFCTLCLLVHAVIVSGAAMSPIFLNEAWSASDMLSPVALLTAYFFLILFLVIPYFTRTERMKSFVENQQRIASSPFATLAQLLTEGPTPVRGAVCGVRLEGPPAPHELVVFVHPSCAACARTIREARSLATTGKVEVSLTIAPKDRSGPDGRACEALVAAGLSLGPQALLDAYEVAKADFSALTTRDPIALLTGHLSASPEQVGTTLERAARVVDRAEELADAHIEGTPAIFFNSRLYPYSAPLAHLTALLEHHPELLEPTRIARTDPARDVQEAART